MKCHFVGLVTRHTTMRTSPTRGLNNAAQHSSGLRRHLEAHLGFPADHNASRVLGKAVLAKRGDAGLAQVLLF
jgi:hypothetical protein